MQSGVRSGPGLGIRQASATRSRGSGADTGAAGEASRITVIKRVRLDHHQVAGGRFVASAGDDAHPVVAHQIASASRSRSSRILAQRARPQPRARPPKRGMQSRHQSPISSRKRSIHDRIGRGDTGGRLLHGQVVDEILTADSLSRSFSFASFLGVGVDRLAVKAPSTLPSSDGRPIPRRDQKGRLRASRSGVTITRSRLSLDPPGAGPEQEGLAGSRHRRHSASSSPTRGSRRWTPLEAAVGDRPGVGDDERARAGRQRMVPGAVQTRSGGRSSAKRSAGSGRRECRESSPAARARAPARKLRGANQLSPRRSPTTSPPSRQGAGPARRRGVWGMTVLLGSAPSACAARRLRTRAGRPELWGSRPLRHPPEGGPARRLAGDLG